MISAPWTSRNPPSGIPQNRRKAELGAAGAPAMGRCGDRNGGSYGDDFNIQKCCVFVLCLLLFAEVIWIKKGPKM